VLQRRQARNPDAVHGAEDDEAGDERFVGSGFYRRSTTPAIAWPKPMHIAAMP
jgi:hypothetical protein